MASVRYTYDEVGNRLTESDETGSLSYSYDDANQLTRAGVTTYEYDRNGNRIAETTDGKRIQYQYDGLNQLSGIRDAFGTQLKYAYDPLGRLIQSERPEWVNDKVMRPEVTRYSYSGQTLLGEWTGNGSPLAEYYTGNGETVTRRMFGHHGSWQDVPKIQTRGNHLYYLHDALGSVTGMTDHQGNPILKYREDAFGNPQAGWLDPYNTRLLTGKPYETSSGLYYFGSRWYDPSVGRFMTQDAYRGTNTDPRSMHRYAYVLNNPATFVDAWGYLPEYKPQPQKDFWEMTGDWVGGAIDSIKADPWRALAIGAGVAAVVGISVFVPGAAPFLAGAAQSALATAGSAVSSAAGFVWGGIVAGGTETLLMTGGGLVAGAVSKFNPQLGGMLESLAFASAANYDSIQESNAQRGKFDAAMAAARGNAESYAYNPNTPLDGAYALRGNLGAIPDKPYNSTQSGVLIASSAGMPKVINPPRAPEGVNIDQNMAEAAAHKGDLDWFYNQVRNGGPWDYKQQGSEFEDYGNFNYGASGSSAGFPEWLLLRAAGYAQEKGGNWTPEQGHWWGGPPYGDDPRDQSFIRLGIEYHLRKAKQKSK